MFEPYSKCLLIWERKIESIMHLPAFLFILQKHNVISHVNIFMLKEHRLWDESHAFLYFSQNLRVGRFFRGPPSPCTLSKPLAITADPSAFPPQDFKCVCKRGGESGGRGGETLIHEWQRWMMERSSLFRTSTWPSSHCPLRNWRKNSPFLLF